MFNATWPFAGLTLNDDGMTLRLLGFVHTRHAWSKVQSVEHVVGGLMWSPGVRITLVEGPRLVFWAFSPDPVLAAFREHGVKVVESHGRPPKVWLGT